MHIPAEHVAWQNVIGAAPDYTVPFATHVFILHTVEQLQLASGDNEANGFSTTFRHDDAAGVGAIILLAKPDLDLSIVAHEATHIALHRHANELGRGGAKRWLREHPESVAEMIGNLTSLLWYGMPTAEEIDAVHADGVTFGPTAEYV